MNRYEHEEFVRGLLARKTPMSLDEAKMQQLRDAVAMSETYQRLTRNAEENVRQAQENLKQIQETAGAVYALESQLRHELGMASELCPL